MQPHLHLNVVQKMSPHLNILLSICFLGCVASSCSPYSDRTIGSIRITGRCSILSEADVSSIAAIVKQVPHIDHRVLEISVMSKDKVEVRTGCVKGPLEGGGDIIVLRRENGIWKCQHDNGPFRSKWIA